MADRGEKRIALELVPAPAIQKRILVVRDRQVMVDEDLADLYGVETRHLVQQVKRNIERFPADFMFQLTREEAAALSSQTATSDAGRGGRRYAPYVFTEQGVAMLSGVLRSKRAVAGASLEVEALGAEQHVAALNDLQREEEFAAAWFDARCDDLEAEEIVGWSIVALVKTSETVAHLALAVELATDAHDEADDDHYGDTTTRFSTRSTA